MTLSEDNVGVRDASTIAHYANYEKSAFLDWSIWMPVLIKYKLHISIAIANAALESIRLDSLRSYGK